MIFIKKAILATVLWAGIINVSKADVFHLEPQRRLVTINNSITCPPADKALCHITVTITPMGRIFINVEGRAINPVSYANADGNAGSNSAKDIAESVLTDLSSDQGAVLLDDDNN